MTLGKQNNLTDKERYHWYQNAQNLFWKSPIWEVQTRFDEQFNEQLLEEIYSIGKDIVLGNDRSPKNSIWDYSRPNLDILKQEIIDIVEKTIIQEIPEIRMLNLQGCEHFMGWINVREPGERLEVHGHTESAIAATYYLRAKEGCGDIVLFDTADAIDWDRNDISGSPYIRARRFKPVEGRLIFFPSYVLHGVKGNGGNTLRVSLSTDFNYKLTDDSKDKLVLSSWVDSMIKIKELI